MTFIINIDVNEEDKGAQIFPFVVYTETDNQEEAVQEINKKYNYPFILAAFEGKLTPIKGEVFSESRREEQSRRASEFKRPSL